MEQMTFRTIADMWYEQVHTGLCYSYRIEIRCLINHMNAFIGDKLITEIKPIEITAMINSLAVNNPNTKRPMAKKSLQILVVTASRIFEMAIDNDWLTKNPARGKSKAIPRNAPVKKVTKIWRKAPAFRHGDISHILLLQV